MGPVQKAIVTVLARADTDLTVEELTVRVFRILSARSGYGGWSGGVGVPLEHHYAAVRRALQTLPDHGVAIEVGEKEPN